MARKSGRQNRLRGLRTASGLGLNEVGRQLAIDKGLLSRYERGEIPIPPDRAEVFADFYGCSPAHVMGWDDPPLITPVEDGDDNGDLEAEAC